MMHRLPVPASRRRARAIALGLLAAIGMTAGRAAAENPESIRDRVQRLSQEAEKARQAGDWSSYLARGRQLLEAVPNNPRALLALARGQAMSGQAAEALESLSRLAEMGVVIDLESEASLAPLKQTPGFAALASRFKVGASRVENGIVAHTLPERDLLSEGLAYDAKSGAWFVSSVHQGKILRIARDGIVGELVPAGRDGQYGVLALGIDVSRRSLWATSIAVPQWRGYRKEDEGRSQLLEFDLDNGRLKRKLEPPAGSDARLGDLVVGAEGTVHVSDMAGGRIYVLRPGAKTLELAVEATFLSAQGLAWSPDGRFLMVADYVLGIARFDPRDGSVRFLAAPPQVAVSGVDGLIEAGEWLIGIQNGVEPQRVVAFRIDPEVSRILEARVLDCAHSRFDEPTLGVRIGDDLYYNAASQWPSFGEDGSVARDRLKPPIILRTSLAALRTR